MLRDPNCDSFFTISGSLDLNLDSKRRMINPVEPTQ